MKLTICTPLLPGSRLSLFYPFLPAFLFSTLAQYRGRQQLQAIFNHDSMIMAFNVRKHSPFNRATMTTCAVPLILPARILLFNAIHLYNNIHTLFSAGATLLLNAGPKVCRRTAILLQTMREPVFYLSR